MKFNQAPGSDRAHAQADALQGTDPANHGDGQSSTGTAVALLNTSALATPLDTAVSASVLNPPLSASQAVQVNKQLLLLHLQLRRVGLATVTYEGGGDEGNTNGVYLFLTDHQAPSASATTQAELLTQVPFWVLDEQLSHRQGQGLVFKLSQAGLEQALEETAWELVTDLHGGFYNGDGGAGELRFHAATQTVAVAHNNHYTASSFSETLV
jgi:hypothetical protein